MRLPRKAVLLAAGYGTRMRPLSWDLPKPLMPLWGKPLIAHVLDLLRDWGVRDALVNLHHQPDAVFQYLRSRDNGGVRLTFSFEPEILGTGGALDRAAFFLDDEAFWIVNTDIAADVRPGPFVREFERRRPLAVLWLDPRRGPRTVETRRGWVTDFATPTPGAPGTSTFCGLHLVSPEILQWIPPRRASSIIDAYRRAMKAGRRVYGVEVARSFWADLGSPEQYLAAHADTGNCLRRQDPGARLCRPPAREVARDLQAKGVAVQGVVCVCDGASVSPGARIRDSVLWPGSVVGKGAVVERAVIGCGALVHGRVTGAVVRADRLAHDCSLVRALAAIGWPLDACTLVPLPARGSDRTFTRILHGHRSAILIQYGTQRTDNPLYAGHARFLLEQGVPVPRVLADLPADRALVMEDVGDESLLSLAEAMAPVALERRYCAALDALLALHAIPLRRASRRRMEPAFSAAVYRWERELFANHCLRNRLRTRKSSISGILSDLEVVARRLLRVPAVLVHRDAQSSNVLWHRGEPVLIDFQSMRLGAAAYDVASLLADPYVMLEPGLQERLLAYYLARSPAPNAVREVFWFAAVERLAQALGAFGRLSALPGLARFAEHIPPAIAMMARALERLPGLPHLKAFARGAP